jgi:hypothetical protein
LHSCPGYYRSYTPRQNPLQAAQLVAEHVLQGELPPIGVAIPSLLFEEQVKEEKILLAPL